MSGSKDILIEQLRERAEKAERERDEAELELELMKDELTEAERERDEAELERDSLLDEQIDLALELELMKDELTKARAERDARPDISAEDAAHAIQFFRGWDAPGSVTDRVFAALRAHAQKAVKL